VVFFISLLLVCKLKLFIRATKVLTRLKVGSDFRGFFIAGSHGNWSDVSYSLPIWCFAEAEAKLANAVMPDRRKQIQLSVFYGITAEKGEQTVK